MELIAGWTCKTAMWLSVTSTLISGLYIAPADARGSQQSSESAAQASTEGAQQIDQHGVAEPPEVIYKTTDAAGRVHYVVTNNGQLAGAGVPKVERQPELVPDPVPDIPAQLVYHPVPSLPPASIRKHHRLALGAARMWKIKPGSKDGLPLRGSITAPITFTLPKSPTTFHPRAPNRKLRLTDIIYLCRRRVAFLFLGHRLRNLLGQDPTRQPAFFMHLCHQHLLN